MSLKEKLISLKDQRNNLKENLAAKGVSSQELSGKSTFDELVPLVLSIPQNSSGGGSTGGEGDMLKSVYDTQGREEDIFDYVDNHTDTTLSGRVDALEQAIENKIDSSEVTTLLNEKANIDDVNDALDEKADADEVNTVLDGKVDKIDGKGLSTNDYTTEEKTKLNGLENYVLPQANTTTLGGVKVDGTSIVSNNGTISSIGIKSNEFSIIKLVSQEEYDDLDNPSSDNILYIVMGSGSGADLPSANGRSF